MPAPRKTLGSLRLAVRDNLDEPAASFWTNAQLTRFINRAKDRVWTEVRKLKADYFLVPRTSTDGVVTILGESYDTANFRLVAGVDTYTLPPDLIELKMLEVITSSQETVKLVARELNDRMFRALRDLSELQTPNVVYFDLVGERTLVIAPRVNTTLDLRLWYVPMLRDLGGSYPITSLTRVLTVATVTTPAPHGLTSGDLVTIAGAVETAYNIAATITVVTPTTFTYTVLGNPGTPATGVLTYTTDTDADPLEMPHPLYKAVEEYATAGALKMDRSPIAAVWEQSGNATIASVLGAHARQSQDPEFVDAYLSDWTGW